MLVSEGNLAYLLLRIVFVIFRGAEINRNQAWVNPGGSSPPNQSPRDCRVISDPESYPDLMVKFDPKYSYETAF